MKRHQAEKRVGWFSRLWATGPAIIVASVVLGPGSILTNSKVGWLYGYQLVWVLALATVCMVGMTALAARLGIYLDGTPCEELARRLGRPAAVAVGGSLFLVAASFQFSNNLGVLYAIEPFLGDADTGKHLWPMAALCLLNAIVIATLFGLRHLYRPVEWLMKGLVVLMILGFAANLRMARPSLGAIVSGLRPQLPHLNSASQAPAELLAVFGLIGTTFSVGGAFYQAYLVRQKGWTKDCLRQGLFDSITGIAVLGLMSLMIMATAAAVLHDNPRVTQLTTAADVARQLEPMFGRLSMALFCQGILAGALSSFLVNAMVGGTVLSDACGWGGSMDDAGPRWATCAALLFGMIVAIAVKGLGFATGNLIVFAQAITVLGNPLLAASLLWLACRPDLNAQRAVPGWLKALAGLGLLVAMVLSVRTVLLLGLVTQ